MDETQNASRGLFDGFNIGEVLNYGIRRWVDSETSPIVTANQSPYIMPDQQRLQVTQNAAAAASKTNQMILIAGAAAVVVVLLMMVRK
jgi:low affinity Fe/Cu permease